MNEQPLLSRTLDLATEYLKSLPERRVGARDAVATLRARLGRPLPEQGLDPVQVIEDLARDVDGGLVASAGPRFFGFVIGGSLPAALAADWLASAWDQNASLYVASPAAAVVEEVVASWLLELFGLPATASVGLVTGGQMANFTGLAAARHAVLRRAGWDVEQDGLIGAPPIRVIVGAEVHVSVFSALRMLGLGARRVTRVPADAQGRMRADELRRVLQDSAGPTIVCAQAGNVNTGAFDPLEEISELAHARGAWLHVDGAFGLWAAASPELRHQVHGLAKADSWAADAHKWLNVPYDSGLAIVADREVHRAALTARASYLVQASRSERDGFDWVPEASRRARGFALYAALRSLGRRGVTDLVERCARLARYMARALATAPGVRILNDVVLNQVLVGFDTPAGVEGDAFTRAVVARVQQEGTCWLGGTRWQDQEAVRISFSNWRTTEADIDRSAAAILAAFRAETAGAPRPGRPELT